jgi:hypothetical protein
MPDYSAFLATVDTDYTVRMLLPPTMSALAVALCALLLFNMFFDRPRTRKRRNAKRRHVIW